MARTVRRGEPLRIPAATWNRILEVVFEGASPSDLVSALALAPPPTFCLARRADGSPLETLGVYRVVGSAGDDLDADALRRRVLAVDLPGGSLDRVVVVSRAAAEGGLAQVVVSGAALAWCCATGGATGEEAAASPQAGSNFLVFDAAGRYEVLARRHVEGQWWLVVVDVGSVHASDQEPEDVAGEASAGVAGAYARADHAHRGVAAVKHDAPAYGEVVLAEGDNVTITQDGSTFTISATGGGGGEPEVYVRTLDDLSGDLTLQGGTGIAVSDDGTSVITITNTGVLSLTADDADTVSGEVTIAGAGTCSTSADPTTNTVTITAAQEVPDNPLSGAILEYDTTNGRQWQEGSHAGDLLVFDGSNWGLFAPEGQGDGYFYWDDETNQWSIQAGGGGGGLPDGDYGDLIRHMGEDGWQRWEPGQAGALIYGEDEGMWSIFSPPSTGAVLRYDNGLEWLSGWTVGGILNWNGNNWVEFYNADGGQLLRSEGDYGLSWLWGDAGDLLRNDGDGWTVWQPLSIGALVCGNSTGWNQFEPEGQGNGYLYWNDDNNEWSIQTGPQGLPDGDEGDLLRHDGTEWQSWGAPGPGYLIYGGDTDRWDAFAPPETNGGVLAWSGTDLFWLQGSTVGGLLHWNGTGWEEFANESGGQLLQSAGEDGLQWLWGNAGQICYNDGTGWGAWSPSGTEIIRGSGGSMPGWEMHSSDSESTILKGDDYGGWVNLSAEGVASCRLLGTDSDGNLVYIERETNPGQYHLRLTVHDDGSAEWSWVSD